MSSFRDRPVFITGASSGIGEYLAKEFVSRGAKVGLLARRQERLQGLCQELGSDKTAWAVADVADGEAQSAALDRLEAALGPPAAVVANAGFNRPEVASKFVPGAARSIYEVNFLGFLHTLDWALPRFLERGEGQIVGVASVASFFGLPHNAAYSGSKAAMRVHLQSLRASLPARGIAVTTICPGFVKSELTAKVPYPMPFLWETDRAARRIADAIEKRRGEVVFPWQMNLAVALLTRLPTRWAEWVSGRFLG